MPELLRCPTCHRWSDALLIWAAGDCCPSCNAEMGSAHRDRASESEHSERLRPPGGLARTQAQRLRPRTRVAELR